MKAEEITGGYGTFHEKLQGEYSSANTIIKVMR
jgi:hypothetical protein